MGQSQSSSADRLITPPEDIGEFRKAQEPLDYYVIPEVPYKRKVTDSKFLIAFGACILFLLPFLIYTLVHSDFDRLTHGYDKCGNVCGKKNPLINGISCTGEDKSNEPFLQYSHSQRYDGFGQQDIEDYTPDKCVRKCDENYMQIFYECFPGDNMNKLDLAAFNKFASELADDINRSAGYIVALCLVGLGFSIGMLLLFRYFVAVVVWVIIIGSLLGVIVLTILFWYFDSTVLVDGGGRPFKVFGIAFTILSIILVIILICMFKRIQLVIRLFKESIKVIFGMPLILLEPLLSFVAVGILLYVCFYLLVLMRTAGTLVAAGPLYDYAPNVGMLFTIWYHLIICIWMEQFIIGCQHMVISGAVSAYYFARDKSAVGSPIYNSFYNLIRYHLGTVAVGSLIVTIITVIKALIRGLTNSRQVKILIECCLGRFEDFLKYLSKNAYIQTAMHGQPFYKSGKRAVRLLTANALSVVAINSVGDFVLAMAKLLIMICTIGVGILMNDSSITHFWAAIVISALVTLLIAECIFAVFETAIDTIFICFCEDSCMNNGMTRPYYTSVNFIQYIEDAKNTIKK